MRPDLVDAVQGAGWGIVVSPNDRTPLTGMPRALICLGLRDLVDRRAVETLRVPETPAMSVKIGFMHVDGWRCDSVAQAVLDRTTAYSKRYLEPYCLKAACLRAVFASLAGAADEAFSLKLAVDPQSIRALEMAEVPYGWLARSDGIPWNSFHTQLAPAREIGCTGVMVGRALWGDSVTLSGAVRKDLVRQRMRAIETALT